MLSVAILNSAYASSPRIDTVYQVVASHYGLGDGFHGKVMANCTVFSKYALTAAHKTLRLGTVVELCNQKNGACRHVTITDRGPYVRGRDIDVASIGVGKPLNVKGDTLLTMRIVSVNEKPIMGSACKANGSLTQKTSRKSKRRTSGA